MRPALFLMPLFILSACGPTEKPADLATAAEAASTEAALSTAATSFTVTEAPADTATCREEIGDAEAKALVARCIMVSPATHPPCHVDNSCQMIRDEIKRSCDLLPPNQQLPAQCG